MCHEPTFIMDANVINICLILILNELKIVKFISVNADCSSSHYYVWDILHFYNVFLKKVEMKEMHKKM